MTDSKEHTELDIEALKARVEDDAPEVKKRRVNGKRVALGALAVIAVSGASVATTLFFTSPGERAKGNGAPDNDGSEVKTSQTPVSVASPEASVTPTPEVTALADASPIPAGLGAQEYGVELTQQLSDWLMRGADDKFDKTWLHTTGSEAITQLFQTTAEQTAEEETDALFVSDWKDNVSLQTLRARFLQLNRGNLTKYVATYNSGHSEDKKPWNFSLSTDSAEQTASDSTSRTIAISGTRVNNANDNRVGDPESTVYQATDASLNNTHFLYVFTTKIENGTERIASWQDLSSN